MKRLTLIGIAVLVMAFSHPVNTNTDYRKIFGRDYTWAIQWLQQNDRLITQYAVSFQLPSKELKAIIFPELIRYNSVFDAIEIESLKYLYVSEGKFYADFSVGYFQMKPSFAEMVERDANKLLDSHFLQHSKLAGLKDVKDEEAARKERVKRLTNTEQQMIYLCAFYKICTLKFPAKLSGKTSDRVRLLATCYNAGYRHTYHTLMSLQKKNQFQNYNYSDVSAFYFENEN